MSGSRGSCRELLEKLVYEGRRGQVGEYQAYLLNCCNDMAGMTSLCKSRIEEEVRRDRLDQALRVALICDTLVEACRKVNEVDIQGRRDYLKRIVEDVVRSIEEYWR